MLQNETALITGASRGIGRCMAESLAKLGVHVAVVARREPLDEVVAACHAHGVQAHAFHQDLCDTDSLPAFVESVSKALHGSISFLINNAGVFLGGNFEQLDLTHADRALDINTRALMLLTHHTLPHILRAKQRGVINIASMSGQTPHGGAAIYCAAKHAVVGFTRALYEDVHLQGVKVSAICPGFVETDMTQHMGLESHMMMSAQDVVNAALYVLTQSSRVCPIEIILRSQQLIGHRA